MFQKNVPHFGTCRLSKVGVVGVLFGLGAASLASGQAVYSNPTGYVKLGNTSAGQPAVQANKDVYLSIPLESKLETVGVVSSTTATTITFANSPSWTVDQWAPSPTPFSAILTSGTENGLRCVISSNTADTLTVSLSSPGDLTNITAGDSVMIRKCWTLKTFFDSMNLPDNTTVLLWDDTQTGVNQVSDFGYLLFQGDWYDTVTFDPSNEVIIHSGETFVLRSDAAIQSLTTFGEVSLSNLRNSLSKDGTDPLGEDLYVGSMSPIPTLAVDSGLPAADGDTLLVFGPEGTGINQPASESYIFFQGGWFDGITFDPVSDTLTLDPGVGYVLRRDSSAPTLEEWTQIAPYSPSQN